MNMLRLKKMSWNDKWQNYIVYGKTNVSEKNKWNNYRNFEAPYKYQIILVMQQLKNKMSVYEAFLKGLEVYYSSLTCGKKSFFQEYRRLQNMIYKDMKKGIVNEFFIDLHSVMVKVGTKRCLNKQVN